MGYESQYDAIRLFAIVPSGFLNKWCKKPSGNYLPDMELSRREQVLRGEPVMQLV